MADPLWIVKRLAAVAKESYRVAKQISTIADEMGQVPAEIQGVAIDLESLTLSVHQLRVRLTPQVDSEVRHIAFQLIARCEAVIADVKKALGPLMSTADGKIDSKARIMWILSKSKVRSRRAMLDSLKPTISLFILGLDINSTGEIDDYVKEKIDNLFLRLENTKATLLHAERVDRQQALSNEPEQMATILDHEGQDSPASSQIVQKSSIDHSDIDTTNDDQSIVKRTMNFQLAKLSSIPSPEYPMDEISDHDLVQIAKHVELKNTVTRYVRKIINKNEHYDSHNFPMNGTTKYESLSQYDEAFFEDTDGSELFSEVSTSELGYELNKAKDLLRERNKELEMLKVRIESEKVQSRETIHNLQEEAERIREVESSKRKLLEIELEKLKAAEDQRDLEARIRKTVEADFQQKMEAMRMAQEEAKSAVEEARIEAENAARKRIEAEREAEDERARAHAEVMKEAEEKARLRFEAELKTAEETKKTEAEARARFEAEAKAKFEAEMRAAEERGKKEAEVRARAEIEARRKFEAELKAAEERRKREVEERARANEMARIRLEKDMKAEAEAKAAAAQKAADEAERLFQKLEAARAAAANTGVKTKFETNMVDDEETRKLEAKSKSSQKQGRRKGLRSYFMNKV